MMVALRTHVLADGVVVHAKDTWEAEAATLLSAGVLALVIGGYLFFAVDAPNVLWVFGTRHQSELSIDHLLRLAVSLSILVRRCLVDDRGVVYHLGLVVVDHATHGCWSHHLSLHLLYF